MLRTMLRACCLYAQRPVLGLFDHDKEGMEQFISLKKTDGFSTVNDDSHARHHSQPVHAAVLPVPPGREGFVSAKPRGCFLALEHYYSDDVLKQHAIADDPVVFDSNVFGIVADSNIKTKFAEAVMLLDSSHFGHFKILFSRLHVLFGTEAEEATDSSASAVEVSPFVACAPG